MWNIDAELSEQGNSVQFYTTTMQPYKRERCGSKISLSNLNLLIWSYDGKLLQKKNEWDVKFDLKAAKNAMSTTEERNIYDRYIIENCDLDIVTILYNDIPDYDSGERVNYLENLEKFLEAA